jgi:hypothetical protein
MRAKTSPAIADGANPIEQFTPCCSATRQEVSSRNMKESALIHAALAPEG